VSHRIDPLTAEEIGKVREAAEAAGLVTGATRFPLVQLEEEPPRRARALLMDTGSGAVHKVLVDLAGAEALEVEELDTRVVGQPPVMGEEFALAEEIVKADAGWVAAVKRRGITDLDTVRALPLSAGTFGIAGEEGLRLLRVLSLRQDHPLDNPFAHPIDGLLAYVDLVNREVRELHDVADIPVPEVSGNFADVVPRTSTRPIEITQPEGASFAVDGRHVSWEKWDFRVGFDPREGLVLHELGFDGRSVLRRASVPEMVVPYGDPGPAHFFQNYFDAGEYSLGKLANSLVLGCDCLGEIHYFDAVLADDLCRPREMKNVVCMHEEDTGVLFKHSDEFTGVNTVRRNRRLVVSYFCTVGNYDYGFFWYLYLDGEIEFEAKATGIPFTSAYHEGTADYSSELAPGLGAPFHQHLFCARLEMAVDGPRNSVEEVEAERVPVGPENPWGNAFRRSVRRLSSESEAQRVADPGKGRAWHIVNDESLNATGRPVGYALHPQGSPLLLADGSSAVAGRAAFATKHLWVTALDGAQRWPAGEFVNQSLGGGGLPEYAAGDRCVDGAEIVVWHSFGLTHFPRLEDWPIMPVDTAGFRLKPSGFFDRNPALDVAESPRREHGCCG
jgi:primary-amine oxidase